MSWEWRIGMPDSRWRPTLLGRPAISLGPATAGATTTPSQPGGPPAIPSPRATTWTSHSRFSPLCLAESRQAK